MFIERSKRYSSLLAQPRRVVGRLVGPRILVASVPKSGTNMLMHTLNLFPYLTIKGSLAGLPLEGHREGIANLKPGQVISSHRSMEDLSTVVDKCNVKVIFITRDPRDVCISLVHYVMKNPEHDLHSYFQTLPDDHTRLLKTICGFKFSDSNRERHWASIDAFFRNRLGWLTHPNCCSVTFEELVGPNGGGDYIQQELAVRRIANHLGMWLIEKDITNIINNIFSTRTATFRRGQIGNWRQEMLQEHIDAFKEVAGQLLIDLGYETTLDW